MPRIVITHAVQDVERWLGGKAERAASLPGATNVTDLVAMDGSNHAGVVFDFDDLDHFGFDVIAHHEPLFESPVCGVMDGLSCYGSN